MLTFLRVATRRLMPAMMLPSSTAPFRLTPSRLALLPAGSSKLDLLRLAPSRLAQFIFTPSSWQFSILLCERSALSRRLQERLAPLRLLPLRLAYLKLMCLPQVQLGEVRGLQVDSLEPELGVGLVSGGRPDENLHHVPPGERPALPPSHHVAGRESLQLRLDGVHPEVPGLLQDALGVDVRVEDQPAGPQVVEEGL